MEFGLPEVAALASSGAIGALLVWGYHKWKNGSAIVMRIPRRSSRPGVLTLSRIAAPASSQVFFYPLGCITLTSPAGTLEPPPSPAG